MQDKAMTLPKPSELSAEEDSGSQRLSLGSHSRAALHPHRRHLLLVPMGVEAGHIVIYNLHLLTGKVGVLIQDDLVLLAVL